MLNRDLPLVFIALGALVAHTGNYRDGAIFAFLGLVLWTMVETLELFFGEGAHERGIRKRFEEDPKNSKRCFHCYLQRSLNDMPGPKVPPNPHHCVERGRWVE